MQLRFAADNVCDEREPRPAARWRPLDPVSQAGGTAVDRTAALDRLVFTSNQREPVDGAALKSDDHQFTDTICGEGGAPAAADVGTSDDLDR